MIKKIKDLTEEEIERLPNKNFLTITNYEGRKMRIIKPFILNSLYGTIDIPDKHILDKEEHDYLRAVCKPYKVEYIRKTETGSGKQFIQIVIKSSIYFGSIASWSMPFFTKDTMYKGMKLDKNYTIEELELDKEWNND